MAEREKAPTQHPRQDPQRAHRHQAQRRPTRTAPARARHDPGIPGAEDATQVEVSDTAFTDFMNGKWGTASEARRYLSISLSVLRRETRRGRIKAYVIGGRKLIRY